MFFYILFLLNGCVFFIKLTCCLFRTHITVSGSSFSDVSGASEYFTIIAKCGKLYENQHQFMSTKPLPEYDFDLKDYGIKIHKKKRHKFFPFVFITHTLYKHIFLFTFLRIKHVDQTCASHRVLKLIAALFSLRCSAPHIRTKYVCYYLTPLQRVCILRQI